MRYYEVKFKDYQVSEQDIAAFLGAMPNGLEMTISPFEVSNESNQENQQEEAAEKPIPSKYMYNVDGDTKLVRKISEIFLAKRRKKSDGTFENINYSDAILLTEEEKNSFIKYCKDASLSQYKIKRDDKPESYQVWSDFIDLNYKKNYHE